MTVLLALAGSLTACGDDASHAGPDALAPPWDGATPRDGTADAGRRDGSSDAARQDGASDAEPPPDGGGHTCPDLTTPSGLSRGMTWVRTHEMFLSGLVPSMGLPSQSFADGYFHDFGANAVHLWADGLPNEIAGWLALRPDARYVSWTLADGTPAGSNEVLGGHQPGPGRIGYQVSDEPRNMDDLLAIEAGVRAIRAADPEALVIINFGSVDDHSKPGQGGLLDQMVQYVVDNGLADVLSHDNYSLNNSGFVWLEGFRRWGLQSGLPYWRYIRAYHREGSDNWPTEADLRWHAMLGVTYGYTGQSWFVYQIGTQHEVESVLFAEPGNQDAPRTSQYTWAAAINRDLAYYGRVLVHLTSVGVRHLATQSLLDIPEVADWDPNEHIDPYLFQVAVTDGYRVLGQLAQEILLGFFRDDADRRYIVVQNLNRDGRSNIGNHEACTLRLTFDFSGAPAQIRRDRLEMLDPSSQSPVPVPLTSLGNERASVDLTIQAGDVVFLRYDDGCPWPGM